MTVYDIVISDPAQPAYAYGIAQFDIKRVIDQLREKYADRIEGIKYLRGSSPTVTLILLLRAIEKLGCKVYVNEPAWLIEKTGMHPNQPQKSVEEFGGKNGNM